MPRGASVAEFLLFANPIWGKDNKAQQVQQVHPVQKDLLETKVLREIQAILEIKVQ
jgi:hypothetical protein